MIQSPMGREDERHPDCVAPRFSTKPIDRQNRLDRNDQQSEMADYHKNADQRREPDNCDGTEQAEELYPESSSSSMSSSPPQDFDVSPIEDQQYMLIADRQDDCMDDDCDNDQNQEASSSTSSLSISETNVGDYNSSPVIFNEIADHHHAQFAPSPIKSKGSFSRVIRCPACEKPMRTFYCAKCIQKGKFVTLDPQHRTENSFSETTIEYNSADCKRAAQQRTTIDDKSIKTSQIDDCKLMEELLEIKLRALTRKTDALKTLLNEQQSKLEETKRSLESSRKQVELEKKSHRSSGSKIELIKRFIASRHSSIRKRRDEQANLLDELKQHASRRVFQLTQDVFPIDEVNLLDQQNCSLVNMETSPLLTFSDGSHHQIDQLTAFSIVEPWLPGNGDYSAYSLWVNDNKDQLQAPFDESPDRSSAFRIGAALAYTSQFVKNLATYLDVILPAKMELDMFNRELLNDAQFTYNVAKLNANVIYLCVSQGVDISLIQSQRTLKNLLLLFDLNLCDLGRKPVIELEGCDDIVQKIEFQLVDDLSLVREDYYDFSKFLEDDEADDDGVSDSEWEISDTITNAMELQMVEQSIQQNSYISRPLRLFSSFWSASGN